MDINKHRYYMTQLLLAIFRDSELSRLLAFKGGTSMLMFRGLTRFSTDLDFNLLVPEYTKEVYSRLKQIAIHFGTIDDEAMKFFGPIINLNYEKGERMLKIEVSNRQYDNHYETVNLLGTDIRVMTMPDMFAHKLCALGERVTPRDIFDIWFFLNNRTEINANIVRLRTDLSLEDYVLSCAQQVSKTSPKELMQGLGEVLTDNQTKNFVRTQLIDETASLLELFAACPLVAKQKPTHRLELLDAHPQLVQKIKDNHIDLSTISEQSLIRLVEKGETLSFRNCKSEMIEIHL